MLQNSFLLQKSPWIKHGGSCSYRMDTTQLFRKAPDGRLFSPPPCFSVHRKIHYTSFFVFSPTESSRYEKDRLAPDTLPFRYNPSGAEESPEIQVSGAASALRSHANPRAGGLATDGNEHVLPFRS